VPLGTVADQAGCSAQRASVHIGVLESAGVVEKRIERHWVESANRETGEITARMQSEQYLRFVQPATATLQALTTIAPERPVPSDAKPKTGDGQPGSCPEHPEAGTITRWTCACLACGRVLDQGERQDGGAAEGLTLQDERSARVTGAEELTTEDACGHGLVARDEGSAVNVPPYHGSPAVHPMGQHAARSGGGADAGGAGRPRRGDDDS